MLVIHKFCTSTDEAKPIIMTGNVLVNDKVIDKPGTNCNESDEIRIKTKNKQFVSRSGDKLFNFLQTTDLNIENRICLDIGISTGGFTDVLLQQSANHILGIDVAYGLTDFSIRQKQNVSLLERTNARYLTKKILATALEKNHLIINDISLVTMDVSFISAFKIIPTLIELLSKSTEYIILIKPQFEGEQHMIEKGGIITNSNYINQILEKVTHEFQSLNLEIKATAPSKVKGTKGNQEYFYHCKLANT